MTLHHCLWFVLLISVYSTIDIVLVIYNSVRNFLSKYKWMHGGQSSVNLWWLWGKKS